MAHGEERIHESSGAGADDPDTAEVLRIASLDDAAERTSRFLVFGPTKRLWPR
jgi:hypothetical protein